MPAASIALSAARRCVPTGRADDNKRAIVRYHRCAQMKTQRRGLGLGLGLGRGLIGGQCRVRTCDPCRVKASYICFRLFVDVRFTYEDGSRGR